MRLLDAILRRGQALEAAIGPAAQGLSPQDRALVHAIAAETLRRLPDLDALIDSATRQNLPPDAKARFALRIALVQALALGTPHHAAIATVLPLVDGGPRKLVHGVFGTLIRGEPQLPEPPNLPAEIAGRWGAAWGEAVVAAARRAIAAPPPLDLSCKPGAQHLPTGTSLLADHLRIAPGASVPGLPGFAEGDWWVQDIAASLPARMIGQGPGQGQGRVYDLCAAPGGKTLQLAAQGWDVTAVDMSESRLALLSDNLARTGLSADLVAADLLEWEPPALADAVLLDAPCSATGIFRRHPEVLYRAHPRLIADMAALQTELLRRAARWVRPGGRLVFSTCSLEPMEGEAQAERFLAEHPDFIVAPVAPVLPAGVAVQPGGWVRCLPTMLETEGGMDGFFILSLFRRE